MSKSWITLVVIAIITMFAIVGFEFYQSISGANSEFKKHITNLEIGSNLGTEVLDAVDIMYTGLIVKDEELNDITVEQETNEQGDVVFEGIIIDENDTSDTDTTDTPDTSDTTDLFNGQ